MEAPVITEQPSVAEEPAPEEAAPVEQRDSPEEKAPRLEEEPSSELETDDVYHVKWVSWQATRTPIVTQNENGPCPLLSIVNILLLRGKLSLPDNCDVVSASQLLEHLGDVILESVPQGLPSSKRLDYEQNVHDAIAILPKLQTGLDVNVRFTGVCDFEYTPDCIIFDLLNISLYHGWLMDPQQAEVVTAIQNLTYNQLVEKIISEKHSEDSVQVRSNTRLTIKIFKVNLQPSRPSEPTNVVTLLFYFLKLYIFCVYEIFLGSTGCKLQ